MDGRPWSVASASGRTTCEIVPISAASRARTLPPSVDDRLRADGEGQLAAGVGLGPAGRQAGEAGGQLGVVEPGQAAPRRAGGGERGQALLGAAAVLLEVQADQGLDGGSLVVGVEVAAGDQVLGQRPGLVERPGLEGGDELGLVDQAVLEGEQTEEQVAVGGDGGHGAGLPEGRHGRWASGPRRRGPPVGARRIGWIISRRISPCSPAAADRTSRAFDGPVASPAGECPFQGAERGESERGHR